VEPLERLLNLIGLLLETQRPLTFEEIRRTLEPYGQQNLDSAKRMFERDKDLLREHGIPLELVDVDAWGGEQGYRIPKERYYVPDIEFTPEEIAALFIASQGAEPENPAEQGMRKLLFGSSGGVLLGSSGPLASGADAGTAVLLPAADAAASRRRVTFTYRNVEGQTSDRDVEAWAVIYRGGHWYLVGRDRSRDAVRAFRVSRITDGLKDEGSGSDPPDGFDAADHVSGGPWSAMSGERATIAFDPSISDWAEVSLRGSERSGVAEDGRVLLSVPISEYSELAAWVLRFGPDAEVMQPERLRDEMVRRLEELALAYD
jgi:proteasome accessory factor B